MKLITSFLFTLLPFILFSTNYSAGDILNVVAINGLIFRSQPNTDGKKLGLLKNGEKVKILETFEFNSFQDSIFGFNGNWVQIETFDNQKGYVFDAFLSTLPIAKSLTKHGEKLPNNSFEYGEELPRLLTRYVEENFSKSDCSFSWGNRYDGESSHSMVFEKLNDGHVLINHQWYEGYSVELSLENVRISEIYYLVHQFLMDSNTNLIEIKDFELRNPKVYFNYSGCVANLNSNGCGVFLNKNSENSYSLSFNFPCC